MQQKRDAASALVYTAGLTLREACLQASSLLEAAGVEEARANAELLLLHLLGIERAQLLRDWREPLPAERWEAWRELIGRKAAGEPAQYIIGEGWFYGRPFAVTPAVLIPRPETELLVEAVLAEADRLWPAAAASAGVAGSGDQRTDGAERGTASGVEDMAVGRSAELGELETRATADQTPTVLDIGTGSGAIALTLAAERPAWRVYASDLSTDALAMAAANASRLGVDARVSFVQGDLLLPFTVDGAAGELTPVSVDTASGMTAGLAADIVVSNPPYIPAGDLPELQREVRDYEPRLALDGGDDGLDPYRRMVEQLQSLAQLPRIVAFELGKGQAREVARLLEARYTWREVRIIEDYAGIERHVVAIR